MRPLFVQRLGFPDADAGNSIFGVNPWISPFYPTERHRLRIPTGPTPGWPGD